MFANTPLHALMPEIFLGSMACIILLVDLFLSESTRKITYFLAQLT
jgi:NADH-quinone oxidoreductase subunit N